MRSFQCCLLAVLMSVSLASSSAVRADGLRFNEVMAKNTMTILDEASEYEDWIEIYNAGSSDVFLGGMYLTDKADELTQWQFPFGGVALEVGGFLVVWCDDEGGQGPLHANFKLSTDGEQIILVDTDGVTVIDSFSFGAQYDDISYGRYPDGSDIWRFFSAATPGGANVNPSDLPPVISGTSYTPGQPRSMDTVTVTCTVTDDVGVEAVTLHHDTGSGYIDLAMKDDGAYGDGEAGDGLYGAFVPPQANGTTVSYYISARDAFLSVTTDPADAPASVYSYQVGYTPPAIFINEIMADNDNIVQDEVDDYDDWFELYNGSDVDVPLTGMYLTDDLSDPTKWQIPDTVITAHGFLLFWADSEADQGEGPLHTNFSLSKGGETLGLFDRDGAMAIDTVGFGAQTTDISYGRVSDGVEAWQFFDQATPGASNTLPFNFPPVISGTSHTPGQPRSTDTVTVVAQVTDDVGVEAVTLYYDTGSGYLELAMLDDGIHGDNAAGDDLCGAFIPPQADGTVVSYYVSAVDAASAVTTDPADAPATTYLYQVGYIAPPLFINEIMADNDSIIQDEAGDYDDWFELYNAGETDVNLGGMYLTDDLTAPVKWQIPEMTIPSHGFLLFWADEEGEQGPLHADFKLSKGGDALGLFDSDGVMVVDTVRFADQTTNISYGRYPDGVDVWGIYKHPTPGLTNTECAKGDVNDDGSVNVLDIVATVNDILGLFPFADLGALCRADCNGDGTDNVLDALGIVNVILGIGECGS